MKKLLSLILSISIAIFAVGCGPKDDGPNDMTADGKVILSIPIGWGGGVGNDHTRKLGDMFAADPNWGNKQFGKYTGAVVEIVEGTVPNTVEALKSTTFTNVGFTRDKQVVSELKDGFVCLDDIYQTTLPGENRTIEEKVAENDRKFYQGGDGHYYAMAGAPFHTGYAMYTQLWERDQLYIAGASVDGDPNAEAIAAEFEGYHSYHSSKFGCTLYFSDYDGDGNGYYGRNERNGKFLDSEYNVRCVGPDGKEDTYDDGQPSSVIEFLTLCQYMEDEENGIKADPRPVEGRGNDKLSYYDAVSYSGQYNGSYDALFLDAFFGALAGENYEVVLTLNSEGREVEVVVGYSDENLYPGISYIKKPITKKVKITPECGYYATWMVEKYYTAAVMDILTRENYFNYGFDNASSHVDNQYNFLVGLYDNNPKQEATAFCFDGSYQNNEMRINGHFDLINAVYADPESPIDDIRMEFAAPPTSINTPVTCEEEGDAPVLVPVSRSMGGIPIKVAEDPDKLAAAKAWMLYCALDISMAISFVYCNSMNVKLGSNIMEIIENNPDAGLLNHEYFNHYKKKYIEHYSAAYAAGRVYNPYGDDYLNPFTNPNWYKRGYGSGIFYPGATESCFTYLTQNGHKATFEASMYTKATWGEIYKGAIPYADVPDEQKSYKIDGEPVVFKK